MAEAEASGRIGNGTAAFNVIRSEEIENSQREGGADPRSPADGFGFNVTVHENAQESATVGVEQPLPRQRRCSVCGQPGHTSRNCPNAGATDVATRAPRKPDKAAVGMLAPMVVGTFNFCVVTTFGVECGISELEGKLLIPSLQRMMERLPAEAATKAAIIIDPIVILTVLVMWGKRIQSIKAKEAQQKYQVEPAEAARAHGVTGYTYNVPASSPPSPPTAEGMPLDPAEAEASVTSNGVPSAIRNSFDAQF